MAEDERQEAPDHDQVGSDLPSFDCSAEKGEQRVDIHKPKPIHSWGEFLSEIGVIVIGVLIALGAEQAVESIRTREDVAAFRDTINHEIGLNLFVYDVRKRQFACEDKRVAELRSWVDHTKSEPNAPALASVSLNRYTPYRSAWDSRNAQVFNHVPEDIRQQYAEFYDELTNNVKLMENEGTYWRSLTPYSEGGIITLSDRRTIRPVVSGLAQTNEFLEENFEISDKIARRLGISVITPDDVAPESLKEIARLGSECPSLTNKRPN